MWDRRDADAMLTAAVGVDPAADPVQEPAVVTHAESFKEVVALCEEEYELERQLRIMSLQLDAD